MGIIISRFRKKKPTLDILDDLDKRIRDMEAQGANAVQQYKRVSKGLVLYTVGLYVISAVIWYWYWPPLNTRQQLYRALVLVFTPVVIFIMRLVVKLYYTWKIRRNEKKLIQMRSKKKEILEDVMNRETYNVARTILERFAPESLGVRSNSLSSVAMSSPMPRKLEALTPSTLNSDMRRRTAPALTGQSAATASLPVTRASTNSPELRPSMPVAKPYMPSQRTFLDRILEFIVGDGPSNRFALICKSCMCHNGMALKEEFEYLQFRCYNCHHWNPARKQRPQAPRLQESPLHNPSIEATGALIASDTNADEDSSSSDSEDDLIPASAIEISQSKEDCVNETAEIKLVRDNPVSEETSQEHDSSTSKETGGDLETSQESKEIGSDLRTSQEGEEEEETSVRKRTESNGSDKNEVH